MPRTGSPQTKPFSIIKPKIFTITSSFFLRGVFVVRGENVVLLGEIDEEREAAEKASKRLQEVSLEEILEAQSKQQAEKEEQEKLRQKIFKERGLTYTAEVAMDDNY